MSRPVAPVARIIGGSSTREDVLFALRLTDLGFRGEALRILGQRKGETIADRAAALIPGMTPFDARTAAVGFAASGIL